MAVWKQVSFSDHTHSGAVSGTTGTFTGQTFELNNAGAPKLSVKDTTNNVKVFMQADDNAGWIGTETASQLNFKVGDATKAYIDTSGNATFSGLVGIGCTPADTNSTNDGLDIKYNTYAMWQTHGSSTNERAWGFKNSYADAGKFGLIRSDADDNVLHIPVTTWDKDGNATFAGDVLPSADNSKDLGSASYRWANIYSADLQLSNEGTGGNEVDGTEGSWTIQEGEEDLYLLNRKNGKKYKFMLQEIE